MERGEIDDVEMQRLKQITQRPETRESCLFDSKAKNTHTHNYILHKHWKFE